MVNGKGSAPEPKRDTLGPSAQRRPTETDNGATTLGLAVNHLTTYRFLA